MKRSSYPLILASLLCISTSGCSNSVSGRVYSREDARSQMQVMYATVISTQPVTVEGDRDGLGTLSGAGLGGAIGYAASSGPWQPAALVAGAVFGTIAGPFIQEHISRRSAYEIELQLENGERTMIVQEDDVEFRPGERVRLVSGNDGELHVRPVGP